jgi:hypothetical protein
MPKAMISRNGALTLMGSTLAMATMICVSLSSPVAAQGQGLAMLSRLTKGEWTIRHRDGSADRKICVRTGQELIQLRHKERGCGQYVIEDAAAKIAVQYTCTNNGFGRTNIRRETGALVQIESQGIADGLPFQFAAEARHTGPC